MDCIFRGTDMVHFHESDGQVQQPDILGRRSLESDRCDPVHIRRPRGPGGISVPLGTDQGMEKLFQEKKEKEHQNEKESHYLNELNERRPGDVGINFSTSTGHIYNIYANPNDKIENILCLFLTLLTKEYVGVNDLVNFCNRHKIIFTFNANNLIKNRNKCLKDLGFNENAIINIDEYGNLIGG